MGRYIVISLLLLSVITGCSSSKSASSSYAVYNKKAVACYYADKFNGKKTASGEIFSNNKYTAAHRKLPFGTKVRVTNKVNNKSTIVTINDRGPFSAGKDIDLTKKAFLEIADNKNHGELNVVLETIK
jgi:rare lipoprotein A